MAEITLISIDSDPDKDGLGYVTVEIVIGDQTFEQSLCGINLLQAAKLQNQLKSYAEDYERQLLTQQSEVDDPPAPEVSAAIADLVGKVIGVNNSDHLSG